MRSLQQHRIQRVDFGGFRVPTSVEVTWDLEEGAFTYARFRITTIEYNVDERWPG